MVRWAENGEDKTLHLKTSWQLELLQNLPAQDLGLQPAQNNGKITNAKHNIAAQYSFLSTWETAERAGCEQLD
jgi:hypothetical protein